MKLSNTPILRFVLPALLAGGVCASAAENSQRELFQDYCLGCHNADDEKGDLNLELPLFDQPIHKNPGLWGDVIERLTEAEMPPEEENQPTDDERKVMIAWLKASLKKHAAATGKTVNFDGIPVIDTHIHLYDTSRPGGVPWPPKSDKVLYRPILTKQFNEVADKNDIPATVIVEASDLVEDNQWVLDLVKDEPERYIGVVGNLPIGEPEFRKHLKRFSKDSRYVGIRMRQRPRGEDFFNDAVWRDLKALARAGKTLDVLMANFDMEDVGEIARRNPDLKILVNHATGLIVDGPQSATPKWKAQVRELAKYKNVHCKVSGLFQRSNRQPSPKGLDYYKPVLDTLWDAFGEDRLIYGSNWPVTMRGGAYAEHLAIVRGFIAPHGREAAEKLFYRNAEKFYGVKAAR